jgi:hypothetical protein
MLFFQRADFLRIRIFIPKDELKVDFQYIHFKYTPKINLKTTNLTSILNFRNFNFYDIAVGLTMNC